MHEDIFDGWLPGVTLGFTFPPIPNKSSPHQIHQRKVRKRTAYTATIFRRKIVHHRWLGFSCTQKNGIITKMKFNEDDDRGDSRLKTAERRQETAERKCFERHQKFSVSLASGQDAVGDGKLQVTRMENGDPRNSKEQAGTLNNRIRSRFLR
ncbi:uncharacterized protein LOC116182641 [Photinus pyralis]|uniref:uncharacterized protein LOC116182641 n=1 Tax=Photinus pyralis TaxID=7054 RepID=UPI00126708E3|nr:uncharacterized protein LOC116182641 [Photinus pyralis]